MLDALLVKLNHVEILETDREFDLATAYLASSLRREGYEVEIIDASLETLSMTELCSRVRAKPARLIGLSVWLHQLVTPAEELIRTLRKAGVNSHITMGSHSPTFLYEELLLHNPGLDSVACGEGEPVLLDLVQAVVAGEPFNTIEGLASRCDGQIVYKARPSVCDLDNLPMPALDYLPLLKERRQVMSVLTSRGCYGRCTFCSTAPFYRLAGGLPWRAHSPERVLTELRTLYFDHGLRVFGFKDDNFIGPGERGRQRAQRIAEGILAEGMEIRFFVACRVNDIDYDTFTLLKKAGLARVFLGVESGSQRRLDAFRKGVSVEDNLKAIRLLQELQIPVTVGYIMFSPDTSWSEYKESLDFLNTALGSLEAISDSVHDLFNAVEVYPGTGLAEELRISGNLLGDYHGYSYKFKDRRVSLLLRGVGALRRATRPLGRKLNIMRDRQRAETFKGEVQR